MPQLPISLSAHYIAKLAQIADIENKKAISHGEEPTTKAATIASRIVREYLDGAQK